MTRREKIEEEINYRMAGSFGSYIDSYEEGFTDGANWAFENNGEELLYVAQKTAERTKKEIISKACEWIDNELYEVMTEPNPYYIYDVQSKSYNSLEVLINDFKKAMEVFE